MILHLSCQGLGIDLRLPATAGRLNQAMSELQINRLDCGTRGRAMRSWICWTGSPILTPWAGSK